MPSGHDVNGCAAVLWMIMFSIQYTMKKKLLVCVSIFCFFCWGKLSALPVHTVDCAAAEPGEVSVSHQSVHVQGQSGCWAGVDEDVADNSVNFRILQFNIWQEGTSVPGGYEAIINEIARSEADFITLSEVRNYSEDITAKMCRDLEAKTGKKYYSFRSDDSGILSRHVIGRHSAVFPLRNDRGSIYKVVTSIAGKRVALYTAHLDYTHYACYYPRGYNGNFQKLDGPVTDTDIIRQNNLESLRDEAIASFLVDAQAEKQENSLIFLGGDFNEPSMLDWVSSMKSRYDHNGVVYEWDQSKTLLDAGYKDAYRVIYPNPLTHPGITYPSDNKDKRTDQLTWATEADERERIDFVYYAPCENLSVVSARMVGPKGTIAYNKRVDEETEDQFIEPLDVWPSDHKAVLIEFKLENVDPNAPDLEFPEDNEEYKALVKASTADDKVCYRIRSAETGLYACRDLLGRNIALIDEERAAYDAKAYWWFEHGAAQDNHYVVRNLGSNDNCCLYALDNTFRNGDDTEWYLFKEDNGTFVINYDKQTAYVWTETDNGICNNSNAATGDKNRIHWILEEVPSGEQPAPGLQISNDKARYYYTLLNYQNEKYFAKATAGDAVMETIKDAADKAYYWFIEDAGTQGRYYIRNLACPELYFGASGANFGTEPTEWTLTPSRVGPDQYSSKDCVSLNTAFVLRKNGSDSQVLSYNSQTDGSGLCLWATDAPDNTWCCDAWIFQQHQLSDEITGIASPLQGEEGSRMPVYDLSGRKMLRAPKAGIYIQNGKKFIVP